MPSDTILYDDDDDTQCKFVTSNLHCYHEEKLIIEEDLSEGNIKSLFRGSYRQIARKHSKSCLI